MKGNIIKAHCSFYHSKPDLKKMAGRNSNIELLKIFAILLIVVSHVVQTLSEKNNYINYNDYIINMGLATVDIQNFILIILRHTGAIGNNIFFICSVWYMVDSDKINNQKIMQMIADVWVISILCLCFVNLDNTVDKIDVFLLIKAFFPTTFSNNWYITAYIIFCFLHLGLNKIISCINRRMHFRISLILFLMYIFINTFSSFVSGGYAFQGSVLVLWSSIYFVIAYIKRYDLKIVDNKRFNIILVVFGAAFLILALVLTNNAELSNEHIRAKMLCWNYNFNLFILMFCFGLFNLARINKFYNGIVNYISGLSLLVYIIHENILLRTYYRPLIWHNIYVNYGYDKILLWVLAVVLAVFAGSFLLAMLYRCTVQKGVAFICKKLHPLLSNLYIKFEDRIIEQ